ncbi:helix-turn-helix transcriptional regulator [Clostridium sp. JS66]|uniref:helix-turn-helix transcriptional regulator n=1 Tax=Clostridium sp. JS66 TaxID=3064705 RepID=UPI00298DF5CC|nr:helix-turn-helix transcriptional regulator [Clostridium sp. JS66]WPC40837.1 helix-turn-helix transcriptional regulator [Clostridium sp. JS66]
MKNKIKQLRENFNLTQQDLAEKVDVSRQTIISLENGKYNPSILLAHKIAKTFNLSIEKIFIFEEEEF